VSRSSDVHRPAAGLRAAAGLVLLAMQAGGLGAMLWAGRGAEPVVGARLGRGPAPDLVATLEYLADDAIVVTTSRGLREMALDEHAAVETVTGARRLADLRPGMKLALWLRAGPPGRPVVYRLGVVGAVPD